MGVCISASIKSNSPVFYLQAGDTKALISILTVNKSYIAQSKGLNEFNDTILHYAAAVGNEEAVEWICRQGIDVNAKNSDDWTALDVAIINNHDHVAEFLKMKGCLSSVEIDLKK
ncbi:unnamed protein product [Blepharisma stoltei]|uniref:Uncharacterized protein n=1 Tax=Blepharisma stoltei TaxID=1481888 RepID=A0AAU9JHP8_9CILI|nr:unnamed protein product [Blepharisma stoltei]